MWNTVIKYKDSEYCLEYRSVKDYMIEYSNKNYQNSLMKIFKEAILPIHTNSLNMISLSLFCCCGMIEKNLMKQDYQRNKFFTII